MTDKNSGAQGQDAIPDGRSAASTVRDGSAHTPGPWTLETVKTSIGVCHKIGSFPSGLSHRPITYGCVYEDGMSRWHQMPQESELLANARLMAAAPDLLTACRDVLAQFDAGYFVRNTDSDGCSDWAFKAAEPLRALGAMKAAIAKAEGR